MYNWITKQSNENRRGQVAVVKCARQVFLLAVGETKIVTAEVWCEGSCTVGSLLFFILLAGRAVHVEQL